MAASTIGILHPGDMGQAVGRVLKAHGLRVIVALEGRGACTRAHAAAAGLEDAGSLDRLIAAANLVLSIFVSAAALNTGREATRAIQASGKPLLYADCNAIAMETTRRIGEAIEAAGGRYVDAGIVGPPSNRPGVTRFYASGPRAAELAQLNAHGLDVRVAGTEIGQASLFKTCHASLTKGLIALATAQLTAARRAGLHEALRAELEQSQAALWGWMNRVVPDMLPKAQRWIAEMEEHARTFRELGLPGEMMAGAAGLYRIVAATSAGQPGPASAPRDLEAVAAALAEALGE